MPDTAAERLLTVQEFLDNYPPRGDERRWQLLAGRPVAMAPTSRKHRLLAGSLRDALNGRLKRPCRAEQEACIRPLRPRKPAGYYLADVATSCAPLGRGTDTPDPVVVAEFLSSNEDKDRGEKLDDYRELPSVACVLLFNQDSPRVEVHQRNADGSWPGRPEVVEGMDGQLILAAHNGLSIPLKEIYDL